MQVTKSLHKARLASALSFLWRDYICKVVTWLEPPIKEIDSVRSRSAALYATPLSFGGMQGTRAPPTPDGSASTKELLSGRMIGGAQPSFSCESSEIGDLGEAPPILVARHLSALGDD